MKSKLLTTVKKDLETSDIHTIWHILKEEELIDYLTDPTTSSKICETSGLAHLQETNE